MLTCSENVCFKHKPGNRADATQSCMNIMYMRMTSCFTGCGKQSCLQFLGEGWGTRLATHLWETLVAFDISFLYAFRRFLLAEHVLSNCRLDCVLCTKEWMRSWWCSWQAARREGFPVTAAVWLRTLKVFSFWSVACRCLLWGYPPQQRSQEEIL